MKLPLLIILILSSSLIHGQSFTERLPQPALKAFFRSALAVADVDGDQDLDVLILGDTAAAEVQILLYLNDGLGGFEEVDNMGLEPVRFGDASFSDIDGDGDSDLLVLGKEPGGGYVTRLYKNDGRGNFSVVSNTSFLGLLEGSISFADIDNDRDEDVLINGTDRSGQEFTLLYRNDGLGNFIEVAGTPFVGVTGRAISFADIDNDGDEDVFIAGSGNVDEKVSKLYSNDGSGAFSEVLGLAIEGVDHADAAFVDIDNDGDQDLVLYGEDTTVQSRVRLYLNDGQGDFIESRSSNFTKVFSGLLSLADVDGDSDQDLLIGGRADDLSTSVKIYHNDGTGTFTEGPANMLTGVSGGDYVFADFNNDGSQDLLSVGDGGGEDTHKGSTLLLNNGTGLFSTPKGTVDAVWDGDIEFSDIDNDGDLDLLVTGLNEQFDRIAKLYQNSGTGIFTQIPGTPFAGVRNSHVMFLDVEGDGDDDVFIAGRNRVAGQKNTFYRNDGLGNFEEDNGSLFGDLTVRSLASADIDNDGNVDIVLSGLDSVFDFYIEIYMNNGSGEYIEDRSNVFPLRRPGTLDVMDIDSDGDVDLLYMGRDSLYDTVEFFWSNDGNGNFVETPNRPFFGAANGLTSYSDVDNDGDEDVLVSGYNESGNYFFTTKLYLSNGTGIFAEASYSPFPDSFVQASVFMDMDADGDDDLLYLVKPVFIVPSYFRMFINDGTGEFFEYLDNSFIQVRNETFSFADINGDGYTDLLVSGTDFDFNIINRFYINDGIDSSIGNATDESDIKMLVFPNPTNGETVTFSGDFQGGSIQVKLFDLKGLELFHQEIFANRGLGAHVIALPNLAQGIYLLEVVDGNVKYSEKFSVN